MKWYSILLIILIGIILLFAIIAFSIRVATKISTEDLKRKTTDDLLKLSDDKLNVAVLFKIEEKYKDIINEQSKINFMNNYERTFYVVMLYEIEFNNGGLCQYFINPSKESASFLSDELINLKAIKTEKHYSDFITYNKIDIKDLSKFTADTHDDYINLLNLYPFDIYDNEAMEIYKNKENLQKMLAQFARDNIDELTK